jgi:hypothetical protein
MKKQDADKIYHATLKQLADEVDMAKVSQQMVDFFNFSSQFHHYSAGNLWMIYAQKPDATQIMGFNSWKKVNRFVKKGESGIAIYAPLMSKEEMDDGTSKYSLKGFKIVHVFDVSQTDGEPLPDPPDWKSPEKREELEEALIEFAKSKNIVVKITPLGGETQGVSMGGVIGLSPDAGTKTLIHELAHELLHRGSAKLQLDGKTMELEAESTAYIVAKHFKLNNLQSPNYIALHHNDGSEIMKHMDRIIDCSKEIIQFVEGNHEKIN